MFGVLGGLLAITLVGSNSYRLKAQPVGCTAQLIQGSYAISVTGWAFGKDLVISAAAGNMIADGQGGVTGLETLSLNGVVSRRIPFTGGYSISPDCTGSVALQAQGTIYNYDIFLANGGKSVQFIETDAGVVSSGTATQQ